MSDTTIDKVSLSKAWQRAIFVLLALFCVQIIAFYDAYASMVDIWWRSQTFNHCFFIPVITAYLIWQRRQGLSQLTPSVSYLGVFFYTGAVGLWFLGGVLGAQIFEHLAVVALFAFAIWAVIGTAAANYILFPLAYLAFAVPFGEFLIPILQDWTAIFSVKALQMTGIPIFVEGLFISTPSGDFEVAEACSGVNYLIAALAVGCIFAYWQYQSYWRRTLFIVLAVLVPLVANGIRAYGIIMIAHLSDMKHAVGVDHLIYGWLFFGVVIFLLFSLGRTFSDVPIGEVAEPKLSISNAPGALKSSRGALFIMFAMVIFFVGWQLLIQRATNTSISESAIGLPVAKGWQSAPVTRDLLQGHYVGADAIVLATYQHPEHGEVMLRAAYYARQDKNREVINSLNKHYNSDYFRKIYSNNPKRRINGEDVIVREMYLRDSRETLYAVTDWYQTPEIATRKALVMKLLRARDSLLLDPKPAAQISVFASSASDPEVASQRVNAFLQDVNLSDWLVKADQLIVQQ